MQSSPAPTKRKRHERQEIIILVCAALMIPMRKAGLTLWEMARVYFALLIFLVLDVIVMVVLDIP